MEAYTFNIKGTATVNFVESKNDMTSSKVWQVISTIWKHFPDKIVLSTSVKRGAQEKTRIEDENTASLMSDMIHGCIITYDIATAGGASVNILLGACYEYTLPFGVSSIDTGHRTMVLVLPFPLEGCYTLIGAAEGHFKKETGKEHYMVSMDLDIYIGKIPPPDVQTYISKGHRVYPMMIKHPEYFPKSSLSDSEMETGNSSEDATTDNERNIQVERKLLSNKRKSILKKASNRKAKYGKKSAQLLDVWSTLSQKSKPQKPSPSSRPPNDEHQAPSGIEQNTTGPE